MKKFLALFLMSLLVVFDGFAQNNDIRQPSLGISFLVNDFTTAQRIRSTSLSTVLREKKWAKFRETSPGIAVTYFKGLTKHIDFAGTLAGSFVNYPLPNRSNLFTNDHLLLEGDASVNLKMVSDRYWFTPYITVGIGVSQYKGYYGAFLPVGGGLKVNFFDQAALFITSQYRVPVTTTTTSHHFMHAIGVAGTIGKKKEEPVKVVEIPQLPADTDNDGIVDTADKCPTVPGIARYEGCPVPDTDNDGVNDTLDKCPTIPGIERYEGCPIPDTDNDGVNDEQDKCKETPGVARYEGCPVPDTDNDGVNDEEDKCPTVPGLVNNQGCPEVKQSIIKKIEYAAQKIFFATGSAKLLSTSNKSLDEVVKIMKDDSNLQLSIEGHTDNVGAEDRNQKLSEDRANAVKQYLIKKGIDESRLTAQGFGETQPIADNKTAAGRTKNRRVELHVSYTVTVTE